MQEPEMSYEQHEVHCPLASSWMNEAIKIQQMRKEREGRALLLFLKWQTSTGEEGRSTKVIKLLKKETSISSPLSY